ncbi:MAG: DUF481 domain-containing protein [Gemmatimonadetes bacterium]|nr:DUF481 domain-containing protein [Gemmatimonadota bacterium]
MYHEILAITTVLIVSAPAVAQDRPPPGWYNTTELTAVWTAGNSAASTVGMKNDLRRLWESATFRIEMGGLRTESSIRSRTARGTPSDFVVDEIETSAVTAESYYARGRYDRTLSERTFVFGGAGWNRNTFAGVESLLANDGTPTGETVAAPLDELDRVFTVALVVNF